MPGSRPALLQHCLLLLALLAGANLLIVALQMANGRTAGDSIDGTVATAVGSLAKPTGYDSWRAMAFAFIDTHEGRGMYRTVLEKWERDDVKYQYPPSSLLLFEALPPGMITGEGSVHPTAPFNNKVTWYSRFAVVATILASAALLLLAARSLPGPTLPRGQRIGAAAAFAVAGLLFYPLVYAHQIGQVQVFLNLFLVLSLLAWMRGAQVVAGLLVGACCLFKPQYGVILLWALLARQWRFVVPMMLVCLAGLVASLLAYGWHPHLQYLEVLQMLSRQGEIFWPNQSMNGLLNRLLETGKPFEWGGFPAYNRFVHMATVLSSVAILGLALWTSRRGPAAGNTVTLAGRQTYGYAAMLAALTIASPIAWEHHYGFFLGLFALLLPGLSAERGQRKLPLYLLLAAFLAIACIMKFEALLATNALTTLLASHLYFGALVVFGLLLYKDRQQPAMVTSPTAA